jgi:NAD(P)-dependent dehydrogenase (short-subunit alcohol dehydrogenase family)
MTMGQRLAGRVVLITGASSGIGARFAEVTAGEGAAVVLAVAMDVSDEGSVIAAYDAAEAAFGPVTSVVANAGVQAEGRAMDLDVAAFDQLFAVNVRGVFLTAREGARRMRAAGVSERGRIVLISSITARMQTSGTVAYSASKAAVSHMGRLMAREWARSGPNVTILSPGYIRSELAGDWFETEGGQKHMATWPRRRMLDEDALDAMLVYLLSDESKGVTGSDFTIDDGQSL